MVSIKSKKNPQIKPRDPYKTFSVLTFFTGVLFLCVGTRSLLSGDSAGSLLNGIAGLLFLMASYIFFKKKKEESK